MGVQGHRQIQLSCAQGVFGHKVIRGSGKDGWSVYQPEADFRGECRQHQQSLPIPQVIRPDTDAHLLQTASS